jgi:hypothetical protein
MDYALRIDGPETDDYVPLLAELAEAVPLWSLEIRKNRCRQTAVTQVLAKFRSLRELILIAWYDHMKDSDLAPLATLRGLQYLSLDAATRISDEGLAQLSGLTQLRELDLSLCESITDDGLVHLRNFKKLRDLHLCGCRKLTSAGISAVQAALPDCAVHSR